jgi:hypothetical protein
MAEGRSVYEARDVSVRAVLGAAAGVVMMIVVSLAVSAGLLRWYTQPGRGQSVAGQETAPEPRLHVEPTRELRQHRSRARARIETYGWVDREHDIARIPIERAMQLLAEQAQARREGKK